MTVTLRDGNKIPTRTYEAIHSKLKSLESSDQVVLSDLYNKCKNPVFAIIICPGAKSKELLQKLELMGQDEAIHEVVKKVVLNCIESSSYPLRVGNGLWAEGKDVKPINRCCTKSKCFLLSFLVLSAVGIGYEYCKRYQPKYLEKLPVIW